MSRPFWIAAFSGAGALFPALRFAPTSAHVSLVLAVVWAILVVALIDVARRTPKPPAPRNP